jgi:hypothetical protein
MNDREIAKDILTNHMAKYEAAMGVVQSRVVMNALKQFINPPTAFIAHVDGDGIMISAYPYLDPKHEMNHMVIADVSQTGKVNRDPSFENVVRNILTQCGLQVVFD